MTVRTRSMGAYAPSTMPYNSWAYGPNPGYAPYSGSVAVGTAVGSKKTMTDTVTKGFKRTSDSRQWVNSPMSSLRITAQITNIDSTTYSNPNASGQGNARHFTGDGLGYILGTAFNGTVTGAHAWANSTIGELALYGQAVIECTNKINPAQSQTLVTLAEARQSVDTIHQRAQKLARTILAVKQGRWRELNQMYPSVRTKNYPKSIVVWDQNGSPVSKRNGRTVRKWGHKALSHREIARMDDPARLWLEYRYGWTPLVYDIVDQLKAVNAQALRELMIAKEYEAVEAFKTSKSESSSIIDRASFNGGSWKYTQIDRRETSVRAYAKYRVSDQAGFVNRLSEFGAFDVPKAIWELVPWSFVIDWFVPIGDWLGAITPKVGVEIIASGTVTRSSYSRERIMSSYTPDSTGPLGWPVPPVPLGTSDRVIFERKDRTLGLSVPWFPIPEVKLNFKRLADAAALFKSMR